MAAKFAGLAFFFGLLLLSIESKAQGKSEITKVLDRWDDKILIELTHDTWLDAPEGVDFVIQSKPLTEKQEKELSEFIAKRKLEIKKKSKKGTYTQSSRQPLGKA